MNIQDILAEIASLSPETREHLEIDEQGNRRTKSILHPVAIDRVVWTKILNLSTVISKLKASTITDALNVEGINVKRTIVSSILKYLVESGLMTVDGCKSSTTYSLAEGASEQSELPTVVAKTRGRKAAVQVEEAANDTPKVSKRKAKKKKAAA